MPSNHLIICHPFLILPSIFPDIRVFSNESDLYNRPKYWSFSLSISPSNKYSGLIFFKMDWLDLLAVQVTLKSLLQHHSSKASILWCSAFFVDLFWRSSKVTADGDCSHEIKRCLLPGSKAMTSLGSILKSRDITLPAKVHLVKAMVFPVVMYGCESHLWMWEACYRL